MSKVILLVNVELKPGKREEYLAATNTLRQRFQAMDGILYTVLENQGKEKDSFTEMFTFPDMTAYEAFEDREDGSEKETFASILDMARQTPKYTTLVEVN